MRENARLPNIFYRVAPEEGQDVGQTNHERLEGTEEDEEQKLPYPKRIFFILCTEACERFSFYGMKGFLKEEMGIVKENG